MVTLLQLRAEPWWAREIVTAELTWLGDELCARTGRPGNAAGSKGDVFHLSGAHRSQEWIQFSAYCVSRTYTVQGGLSGEQQRHVAGFDFTPGDAGRMVAQCKRLMAAVRGGRLDEVLEFYGNVDGDQVVDGWDNLHDRAASSDSSHLWHWHLSIDRRRLRDMALMKRIVAIVLDLKEDTVSEADVLAAIDEPRPWESDGVEKLAKARKEPGPYSLRRLLEWLIAGVRYEGVALQPGTAALLGRVDSATAAAGPALAAQGAALTAHGQALNTLTDALTSLTALVQAGRGNTDLAALLPRLDALTASVDGTKTGLVQVAADVALLRAELTALEGRLADAFGAGTA